jgi:hypothetical protein
MLLAGSHSASGQKREDGEKARLATKRMSASVEKMWVEKIVQKLSEEFVYLVGGSERVGLRQPRFKLHLGRREGLQSRQETWHTFYAEVISNGEIAILSADRRRRYTWCGEPIRLPDSNAGARTIAFAEPTHSYGSILQAVADLVVRHGMLEPEVMAELGKVKENGSEVSEKAGQILKADRCVSTIWDN